MNGVRRGAVVAAGAVALVGALGGLALADAPTKTGWWNAATAGGVALPQPTTGADDLHVSQGPNGPAAIAAVAYDLAGASVSSATLELAVAPSSAVGTVEVVACPTKTAAWKAGGNQPYDARPAYDCGRGVPGKVAADGSAVTFQLSAAQESPTGGFSLALVPAEGAAPFSLDVSKPAATSLTARSDAPPVSRPEAAPPAPAPAPGAATSGSAPLATGTVATPPLAAPGLAPLTAPEGPQPQAAPAPVPAVPFTQAAAPLAPVSNRDRYTAGTLLALLAGGLVWAFQQPAGQPRLIGGLARKSGPQALPVVSGRPRGLGRHAALRTAPARRLV